jgi:hypothetical protein
MARRVYGRKRVNGGALDSAASPSVGWLGALLHELASKRYRAEEDSAYACDMHISPSLSRKLRETLGHDAGGDLVTWLDEQREQSEQLHADMAELRQEMLAMESRLTTAIVTIESKLTAVIAAERADTKAELAGMKGVLAESHAQLSAQIADVKSDLMKWSFVFWCGAVTAVAALAGVLR